MIGALVAKSVKSDDFLETYPNQVPTLSKAARWRPCPDPFAADPTDESQWTWTENPIRHLLEYKLAVQGVDYATKIAPTLDYWKAAAAICDEAVALKGGGTEARWRSCVQFKYTDPPKQVEAALLGACDGWMAQRADGALVVFAGKYTAPGPDDGIGPEHIIAFDWDGVGVDDDTAVNELACAYVSRDHAYSTVDADAWRDEADIAERGKVLSENFEPQVPSHGQVRRLAKRRMARANQLYRGTISTNIAGRKRVRGKRYIRLRIAEAGTVFFDGVAEVLNLTRNISTGGVTFSWVAADPNIDAWNPATEEGDPAPVGDRVALTPLTAPTITAAQIEYDADASAARARLSITGPDRTDLTWYARWRVTTDSAWNEQSYSDIDPGASVQLVTGLIPTNVAVDFETAYQVGDGRISPWSTTVTESTAPKPNPPTDVTLTGGTGQATLAWRNPTTANYAFMRVYRGGTTAFGSATQVNGDISGGLGQVQSITVEGLAAGVHYFWLRAYSGNGAPSSLAGFYAVTVS